MGVFWAYRSHSGLVFSAIKPISIKFLYWSTSELLKLGHNMLTTAHLATISLKSALSCFVFLPHNEEGP